jgi:hypothetical protein
VRHSCLGRAEGQEIRRRNEGPSLNGQKQTNAWSVANGRNRRRDSCGRASDVMGPLEPATTSRVRIGRGAAPWQPGLHCCRQASFTRNRHRRLVPRGVRRGDQLTRAWIAGAAGRPNPCRASGTTRSQPDAPEPASTTREGAFFTVDSLDTYASPMHSSLHRQAVVAAGRLCTEQDDIVQSLSQSVGRPVVGRSACLVCLPAAVFTALHSERTARPGELPITSDTQIHAQPLSRSR